MNRYKKRIAIIAVGLICLFLAGNSIYKNYIRIQNIFDQMYYPESGHIMTGGVELWEDSETRPLLLVKCRR